MAAWGATDAGAAAVGEGEGIFGIVAVQGEGSEEREVRVAVRGDEASAVLVRAVRLEQSAVRGRGEGVTKTNLNMR